MTGRPVSITPVILCGGSGTRLWPVSRKSYPKQFGALVGQASLFQTCAQRCVAESDADIAFSKPLILTQSDFRFIVGEQLDAVGIVPETILIEPSGRNTAPAILAAALYAGRDDPDAVLLVMPSDQLIPDRAAFHATVAQGLPAVEEGRLVTFGIHPTRPETGYGYLELATAPDGAAPVPLKRFVEKPDAVRAEEMMQSGRHLWNAGIFLFRVRDILAAYDRHAPDLVAPVRTAVEEAAPDLDFHRLDPAAWRGVRDISVDYAVMEKADALSVVPYDGEWSDLGGWDAIWREGGRDIDGVGLTGPATAIGCRDSLLRSDADGVELVGIGLRDIVAVATKDAVLVADMRRAQDVRQAVEALAVRGAPQAKSFPVSFRPWGWFERLAEGDRFQVKRIHVHPGAALSLQSHVHRAEHWVVVEGVAKVTVGEDVGFVAENQSIYVPLGAVHRLENPGDTPMVLIEVQTGGYLGEDDIVRYDDVYARASDTSD